MRSVQKISTVFLIIALGLPFWITGAWLSDKKNTGSGNTSGSGGKTPHGYSSPALSINDANYPQVALINCKYDASQRQVTITWQDSVIKKNALPSSSVTAFGPKISWDNQGIAEFRYLVVRFNNSMDSTDNYFKGKVIGTVKAGVGKYVDTTAGQGNNYYAIGILDSGNSEYFKPSYDQTYASEPVFIGDLPVPVTGLSAKYAQANNTVTLTWTHPSPANVSFKVFMASSRIGSEAQLGVAVPVGASAPGQTTFSYSPKSEGSFYYAVVPYIGSSMNNVINTGNATQTPLVVKLPSTNAEPTPVAGIMGTYNTVSRMINLRWQYRDSNRPGLRIYLNHKTALTNAAIAGTSMLIKDLPPGNGKTGIDISATGGGDYYLGIISYSADGRNSQVFNVGENVLSNAVVIPGGRVSAPTNRITITNNVFITNITPVFVTNYKEIPITLTNYVTNTILAGTNTNLTPAFLTNTVSVTNMITNTVSMTNMVTNTYTMTNTNTLFVTNTIPTTNSIFITNMMQMTNTNIIDVTNVINVTNTVQQTNYINTTNMSAITNTVFQTNTLNITNYTFRTLYLTNRVIIQSPSNSGYTRPPDNGYRRDTGTPSYQDSVASRLKLRRGVQLFFRSRDRRYRGGLEQSIRDLRAAYDSTSDQSVRDQCLLFMGRAYYALGQYLTAFRHFVRVQDRLPDESRYWIRRCVGKMR